MPARLTFRLKLFIASALALIAVAVALTASQAALVKRSLIDQLRGHAVEQRPFLVAAFAAILAERDYASIQAIVAESVRERGLAHLAVLDSRGNVIAARGWTPDLATAQSAADHPVRGSDGTRRIPFNAEVRLGGQLLGTIHFGFSYEPVAEALRDLMLRSILVAGLCLMLTIAVVRALHARLMRPLGDLARASEGIRRGDYDFHLAPTTQSDIADLANSFRLMAEEIRRRIRSLSESEEAQRSLLGEAMVRERALSVAQRDLALQAEKLERALSREREITQQQRGFVSIAAHEFRTPLTIIDGAAQRIARMAGELGPDDLRRRTAKIRGAVERMSQLIDRTLDSERIERGAIVPNWADVDLSSLLRELCARADLIAPGFALRLEVAPDADGLTIEGDATLLAQVFANLISNAVKFSGRSRVAEVVLSRAAASHAVVAVRDSGIGIPEADVPRLFARFFRAENAKGIAGVGLGLNLVHEFVAMHGGAIDVSSRLGAGTTVTVRIPLRRADPASDRAATDRPQGDSGRPPQVNALRTVGSPR